MHFLVNVSPPKRLNLATSNFVAERSHDVEGTGQHLCDLDPKVNVKGQILNFLVNASPPKAFDVVTSNSVGA